MPTSSMSYKRRRIQCFEGFCSQTLFWEGKRDPACLSKITTLNPTASCEQLDVFHLRYPSIHSHAATAMLLRESSGSSWKRMFNEAGDKIAESIGYVHHRRQHANLTFLQGKCPAQHRDIHVQPSFDTMSKKKYIYIYI